MTNDETYYGLLYLLCLAEQIKRIGRKRTLPKEETINWEKWEQKAMEEYREIERPKKITEDTLCKILMDDNLTNYRQYFEAKFLNYRTVEFVLPLLKV